MNHRVGPVIEPADITDYLATPSAVETEIVRLFGSHKPLVIFDVGACEAEDSIRYARRFPNAAVYAFEPLPENLRAAAENIARHNASNVELLPLALGDKAGPAQFNVSSGRPEHLFAGADWNYGNKSSSLLEPASGEPMYGWLRFERRIVVECETLQGFCASRGIRRVDFIHIDVQGAEALVLAGAGRMLETASAVWLEVSDQELYKGQALRPAIEALMHRRGFRLATELRRDIEGDQLYVNLRRPAVWRYLLLRPVRELASRARFALGRHKHAILGARGPGRS